ncbi:MAG: SagB/ThcOx family dehydrogenase, partial [Anaerolineae bacterium]|jgi:SagB-type dehydrogenase family enzyme
MLLSGLYVATTGLVAGLFGLHQLAFHRYAGYLCTSLIVAHIALNWRRMISYVVCRLKRHQRRGRGVVQERRRPADLGRRQVLMAAASAAAGFLLGRLVGERGPDLPGDAADIGALYHAWSTPGHPLDLPIPDWGERVAPHKSYPDAERLVLPDPGTRQGLSVADALETRRSVRSYSDRRLSLEELSNLLHGAQGITDPRLRFRAAPSAGALYPIETYTVVHDVTGLAPGIYHYAVMGHALECLDQGNFRTTVTQAGLGQAFLGQANVCFILSAVFQRTRWRYRERAYRYVLLEAGHIGQNLYLTATSMGLGACAVGAFLDTALNEMLGLDGKAEGVLYVISVGART